MQEICRTIVNDASQFETIQVFKRTESKIHRDIFVSFIVLLAKSYLMWTFCKRCQTYNFITLSLNGWNKIFTICDGKL